MNRAYAVEVTRDGRWWMINIPEVDGLTQARRLADVEQMAKELITVTLDVRLSEVEVSIAFGEIAGVPVGPCLETIKAEKAEAVRLEADAADKSRALVRDLISREIPLRDIRDLLGVSFHRVPQLAQAA